ncbi:MAG: NAD(P)H-dependent oxidoreductase [Thiotrichales bacterium]|nr:NAD(P)H-dependent oxidoreductase [Thiotrichales bacterium]
MTNLVRVDASALPAAMSHSKQLADVFQTAWQAKNQGKVVVHTLADAPFKHLDGMLIGAMYTPADQRTAQQKIALETSDQLIAELKAASHLLITTPMYNFGIPSTLKSYLDQIARVGETFVYTEDGPKGLLSGCSATIIMSSGGDYTQPPLSAMDFVTPYLKTLLGFIGITEVAVVVAPGLGKGEEAVAAAMQQAKVSINKLF